MAFYDTVWYCNAGNQSTTGYYAVTKWAASTAVAAGVLRRQLAAPSVNNERVFVCIVAGTTGATEPTWVLTRGAKTTDGTVTWMECTGGAAVNGDLTNTTTWAQVKAVTPAVLGQIIKRSNNASYQICTTAGAMSASEPAFSDTAGVTTTDTTAVWTSLGVVGNFTGGLAPHARLLNALQVGFIRNNTVYVGDNHAESQSGGLTIQAVDFAPTAITKIICHNRSGNYPPAAADLTTGASIAVTGAFSNYVIGIADPAYYRGITFRTSGQASSISLNLGVVSVQSFDSCSFVLADATQGNFLNISSGSILNFNNCTFSVANVSSAIACGGGSQLVWSNTGSILAGGSLVPNTLFNINNTASDNYFDVILEALDLSQITSTIFTNSTFRSSGRFVIKDCKLNSSVMLPPNLLVSGVIVQTIRSDSGATAYKSVRSNYEGTETTETSITRVGGASDPTGQAQSRKIVTTANSQWLKPFRAEPYAIWNPTTGANVTVTVCGVNAGTLPNNDDLWIETEYLGSSATPIGSIVTSTKATLLSSNAAVASDSSTWNNAASGAGDPYWSNVKFLAGFEGANGSLGAPGMTDESSAANGTGSLAGSTLTAISTSQFKFGTSSLLCSSGSYQYPNSTNFALGSTPFTVEAWVYPTSVSGVQCYIAKFGSSAPNLGWTIYQNGAVLSFNGSPNGTTNTTIMSGGTLVTSAWQHVCADFDGTKYRLYLNGVMVGSSTTLVNIFNPTSKPLAIGANSDNANNYSGWIDEPRLTNGTARYASDSGFAVPTAAYPRVVGGWTPFKLTTTITPAMAGYIHVRVRAAKPSTTYYIDPQIMLS